MVRQQNGAGARFFSSRISSAMVAVAHGSMGTSFILAKPTSRHLMEEVRVVLISTYELGRQPFGLASPAAWLRADGHDVTCADLACSPLPPDGRRAGRPDRLLPADAHRHAAVPARGRTRARPPNPARAPVRLRPVCAAERGRAARAPASTRSSAANSSRAGRSGAPTRACATSARRSRRFRSARQQFLVPDRTGLPPLGAYAQLVTADGRRRVGYTEASPRLQASLPPLPGRTRLSRRLSASCSADVVLEDIRRQVAAGRRAHHVRRSRLLQRPGPRHADRGSAASRMAGADLRRHHQGRASAASTAICCRRCSAPAARSSPAPWSRSTMRCSRSSPKATRAPISCEALGLMRAADLPLSPTFIPFTSVDHAGRAIATFCATWSELGLAEQVAPVQLAIRLLIPEGSLLLELPEVRRMVEPFDAARPVLPVAATPTRVDALVARRSGRPVEAARNAARAAVAKFSARSGTLPTPAISRTRRCRRARRFRI